MEHIVNLVCRDLICRKIAYNIGLTSKTIVYMLWIFYTEYLPAGNDDIQSGVKFNVCRKIAICGLPVVHAQSINAEFEPPVPHPMKSRPYIVVRVFKLHNSV